MAVPFALTALAFTMQLCLSGARSVWGLALAGGYGRRARARRAAARCSLRDQQPRLSDGGRARVLRPPPLDARPSGDVARPLRWGAAWLGGSFLLFLPYWRTSHRRHKGRPVHARTHFSIFLKDEFLIYGLVTFWVVATMMIRGEYRSVCRLGRDRGATVPHPSVPFAVGKCALGLSSGATGLYVALRVNAHWPSGFSGC